MTNIIYNQGHDSTVYRTSDFGSLYTIPKQARVFTCLQLKSSENNVGKGETARFTSNFSFSTVFSNRLENFCHFHQVLNCRLQTLRVWKSLKFVILERIKPCIVKGGLI